jgi:hypothetical protein
MEYAGFEKGSTAFAGLETWKSPGFDIDFVLNPDDPELKSFWFDEFYPLYVFLCNEQENVMLWNGRGGLALLVKL